MDLGRSGVYTPLLASADFSLLPRLEWEPRNWWMRVVMFFFGGFGILTLFDLGLLGDCGGVSLVLLFPTGRFGKDDQQAFLLELA